MKRIEEVCRLSGVSRRTLQYYDNEGILSVKRSEENYRLYDETAMARLWEILWYKEMGVELTEALVSRFGDRVVGFNTLLEVID